MISKLYESIATGLKAVKLCRIYTENVPQDMSIPSFLITIYEQGSSGGINGRKKNEVGFDVMYFPENEQAADAIIECWEMGENMNLLFRIPDFKMKDRDLKVTDNVLHYTFKVPYRTIIEDVGSRMQEISQNTGLKEE